MANDDPICCISIGFFVGIGLVFSGVQTYQLAQKIKNTPTSKTESAAVGLVELIGKAKCQTDMSSPISKAKSVYWSLKCEYYQSGKHGGWRDLYHANSSNRFYLEDDTGKMLVEPKGATIVIPSDYTCTGRMSEKGFFGLLNQKQLDKKVLDYLDANPTVKQRFVNYSGHDLRVIESFIAEGDPLYVLGTATPIPGASSAVGSETLVVQKSAPENIMYLSDSSEKAVLDHLKWWWAWTLGGLLISSVCLWYMLSRLGV